MVLDEQASQRQGDWNEVDGENYEVESRDSVRRTERNDQLYVTRMMLDGRVRVMRDEKRVLRG